MNKTLLINLMLCATLTACGGGGSDSSSDDNGGKSDNNDTAPTVTFEKPWAADGSTVLSANESLVLNFSESMQPNTLILGGNMAPDCGDGTDPLSCLDLVWNQDSTQLTLTPKDGFYWYANSGELEITIIGDGTLGLYEKAYATVLPIFENHQAADIVIGQESFISDSSVTSDKGLFYPTGLNLVEESGNTSLIITDTGNNRIVKYDTIPASNHAVHSTLFGQMNSTTVESDNTLNRLNYPTEADYLDGRIYVSDSNNDRAIWLTEENFVNDGVAESVIGKDDFNQGSDGVCSENRLSATYGIEMVKEENETYWLVADYNKNRIMVWKNPSELKGADANFVLGQDSFDTCTQKDVNSEGLSAVSTPSGIWSNGQQLIVVSQRDRRLLVWNEFPTETAKQPNFQLGQINDFLGDSNAGQDSANQKGFGFPHAIGGNDYQICVTDTGLDRVTIWNNIPSSSEDIADVVIGQVDFDTKSSSGSTTSQSLQNPKGCDLSMEQLFISDSTDNRVLIYNALNKRP